MTDTNYIDTVAFEFKKQLHQHSMKGQLIQGAKILGAAILLLASSYLGTTLSSNNLQHSNEQRISKIELANDIYESIPEDLNITIIKQNQMLSESQQHKAEIMAKLDELERNQHQLAFQQETQIKLEAQRFETTLAVQAEQLRRERPVKQSVSNHTEIIQLKAKINELARLIKAKSI